MGCPASFLVELRAASRRLTRSRSSRSAASRPKVLRRAWCGHPISVWSDRRREIDIDGAISGKWALPGGCRSTVAMDIMAPFSPYCYSSSLGSFLDRSRLAGGPLEASQPQPEEADRVEPLVVGRVFPEREVVLLEVDPPEAWNEAGAERGGRPYKYTAFIWGSG